MDSVSTFYLPALNSALNNAYKVRFLRGLFAIYDGATGAYTDYFFADDDFSAMRAVMSSNLRNPELAKITRAGAHDMVLCRIGVVDPSADAGLSTIYFDVGAADQQEYLSAVYQLDPQARPGSVRIAPVSELLVYVGLMDNYLEYASKAKVSE